MGLVDSEEAVIRWGIAGTGGVANAFAEALAEVPDAWITGVGSRSTSRAAQFADTFGVLRYGSYEELWNNPDVDIVYVATPASHHYPHTSAALEHGKHVLVEKPFTVNSDQAHFLRTLADASDLFLMEAMWPRFLPSYEALGRLLNEQAIGDVHILHASFGGKATFVPELRPFRLDLAGGALMDGGVYPIQLAHLLFGAPSEAAGLSVIADPVGVDDETVMALSYPTGELAMLATSTRTTMDGTATIYGTEGTIQIPGNFTNPSYLTVVRPEQPLERIECIPDKPRLAYQAIEVQRCLSEGLTVSPLMPPSESCRIMETLGSVREQIGLRFPDEVEAL